MPEIRHDPHSDRTAIYAAQRQKRPHVFGNAKAERCPFCSGNEEDTPPTIAVFPHTPERPEDTWRVRVVPNKYPAVEPLSTTAPITQEMTDAGFCQGVHEVIIEAPEHIASFTELTVSDAEFVFAAYRDRLVAVSQETDLPYAQVFKNVGVEAGASIEHAHSQLLALKDVPLTLQREYQASQHYYAQSGQYLHQAWIEDAQKRQSVVCETEHMIAFCPRVSRFAWETWIMPRVHAPSFQESAWGILQDAVILLQDVIRRVELLHPHVAYNYLLHTAPFDTTQHDHYHWHIELFPRLAKAAGFEWATGWFVNTMTPESAAEQLRSVKI